MAFSFCATFQNFHWYSKYFAFPAHFQNRTVDFPVLVCYASMKREYQPFIYPARQRGFTMPRISTKENKNIYHQTREALGLTREAASELLQSLSPERIEKIENERCLPHPDEVLLMAEKYRQPSLCNFYCANQCPIGQQYVPEITIKDLSQIVLEMLVSLNSVQKSRDRLIEITVDGQISRDEIQDFIQIQQELERISICVETLQLWSEQMLATGKIDPQLYQACKEAQEG